VAVPVTITRSDAELVLTGAAVIWSMAVVATARAYIFLVGFTAAVLATTLRGLSEAPRRAAATAATPVAARRRWRRHVPIIKRKCPLLVVQETYDNRSGTGVDVQSLRKTDDAPLGGIDRHTDLPLKQKRQQRLVQRWVPQQLWAEEHRRRLQVDDLASQLLALAQLPAVVAFNSTNGQDKVRLQIREMILDHGVEENGVRLNARRWRHLACDRLIRVGLDDLSGCVGLDGRTGRMNGMNGMSGLNELNGMKRIGRVSGADSTRHEPAVKAKVHTYQTEA